MDINQDELARYLAVTAEWDFELAKEKIIESKGWSLDKVNNAVQDYKRYMALTKILSGYQLVPNEEIDEIWHMHILDTRQYMIDCENLFGEYLHHYPYFGMLDESNKNQWLETQNLSENIWKTVFGSNLYSVNNMGQKCPQVCPCHKDGVLTNTAFLKKAI